MNIDRTEEPRKYRMSARAEAAAATGERIVDAAVALFWQRAGEDFSLEEVAERAGVTVRTVIRRFGGKRELVVAAAERETARVRAQRERAPVGDLAGAVRVLLEHYEQLGDQVVRLLAEEHRRPELAPILAGSRALHADWCERVFAPALAAVPAGQRAGRHAQFVALCDVYTWKILRRDRRLSLPETERALVELLEPLIRRP